MSGTPESKTPGAMIAAARRQRGLSAEDLAERTKIPVTMLAALEADEYHRLSGPLYARSFLRSCAAELGLSADDVLEIYARHSGETPRAAGEPPPVASAVRIRRVGLPWARIALGVALAAGLGALSFVLTRPGDDEPAESAAAGSPPAGAADVGGAGTWSAKAGVATVPKTENETAEERADESATGPVGAAPAGVPGLGFADGMTWPLVVRLSLESPATVRARRDGDESYADVTWPASGQAETVPVNGIVAGRAYATATGLVVYWGAVGRLSLVLGAVGDHELTVNGEPRRVDLPAGGGEVVLDLEAAAPQLP